MAKQWSVINEILRKKNKPSAQINKLKTEDNCNITDRKDICNTLNNFFVNVGPTLAKNVTPSTPELASNSIPSNSNSFFLPITPNEVFKQILSLNSHKALGPDNISVKYIKTASEFISITLCEIFNKCVIEGIFPNELKIAKVIPLYKNSSKQQPSNYRPISILSPFSKIFENIILEKLTKYLSKNDLLKQQQYGFRANHSTSHLLADVVSLLNKNTDNNKCTCLNLLHLKKAFDIVDHKILLAKLEKYGIRGNVHKLIENYLTDRQQYVNANSTTSDLIKVCCGVPQGSTLGPTLFSLYINDLPNISNFTVRLFADDTALITQDENLSNLGKKVNGELINVELWLRKNKLSLNCDKTSYLVAGPCRNSSKTLDLSLNGSLIKRCTVAKYL